MELQLKAIFPVLSFILPGPCQSLLCFHCGGISDPPCQEFNSTRLDAFARDCSETLGSCKKGWVNGAKGAAVTRGCSPLAVDSCMSQNAGGACTCTKDLCNPGLRNSPGIGGRAAALVAALLGWRLPLLKYSLW